MVMWHLKQGTRLLCKPAKEAGEFDISEKDFILLKPTQRGGACTNCLRRRRR